MKLRVYETYVHPWASKVGRLVPGGTIWVVDGFAGRGRYRSGQAGSPQIAMQESRTLAEAGRNFRLQCIFGETKPSNQAMLRELRGRYPEASAMIIEDDFWQRTDDVVRLVGHSPVLLFVDPFGLLGIDFVRLADLVRRLPRVDLIINFRSPAAARLERRFTDRITWAVGSEDWMPDTVGETFRRNLQGAGGFLTPASLRVRTRLDGHVRSELVLAARVTDAYELWNDQVVLEAERLMGLSDPQILRTSRDEAMPEVVQRIVQWAHGRKSPWRRDELIAWHVVEFCGDAHTGTVKRALDSLVASGQMERTPAKGKIDDARFRLVE